MSIPKTPSISESIHNLGFNYGEFTLIRNKAGLNSSKICNN